MSHPPLNWITNFIWAIADDVLRDVYARSRYRDVILPMVVIRRLDAVLEPTKQAVLELKRKLDSAGPPPPDQDTRLRKVAGQAFYNSSPFTLRDLGGVSSEAKLRTNFELYLNGFSPNVQEILDKLKFRMQLPTLVEARILGSLLQKFLDPSIHLGPQPLLGPDGSERLAGLDNHAMGTIFEELIRRFNEEQHEETGEHFTPRDVVRLMADCIFCPIKEEFLSGTYHLYDGACGTGGMLTVAEDRLRELAAEYGKKVEIHLYGQEVNPETYAITKADLLLKGQGEEAENFALGSTLSIDAFAGRKFDFMLSNPPYGKSWKTDLERMGGKDTVEDPRFVIEHAGERDFRLITRSSDGQLMFLVNMLAKMNHDSPLGSRIAEVHNGSSLFTGDAGQGESNIRRWMIENDWVEAIIALPTNMFYNTSIATYIWVLTNRKSEHRRGKVQLIDATGWSKPLRKNLGKKNTELSPDDIKRIITSLLAFEETEQSKIFPNQAFGYWKITVDRPLRLRVDLSPAACARFRSLCADAKEESLAGLVEHLAALLGPGPHLDYNAFLASAQREALRQSVPLNPKRRRLLQSAVTATDERAEPVIKTIHKPGKVAPAPIHGRYPSEHNGHPCVIEYEADPELHDTEQVPLLEEGGIEGFFQRDVLPYAPDAWMDETATRLGYQISFPRYFYRPERMRTLAEIRTDIAAVTLKTADLLAKLLDDTEPEACS